MECRSENGDITVHDIEKYVDCTDEYFDSRMNDDTKKHGVSENIINICTDNIKGMTAIMVKYR